MATVITSIGSNSSIDTETPSGCTAAVPVATWVTTFVTDPTGVSVGDICLIDDESSYTATFTYLVTAISGSDYTLAYVTDDGANGAVSPCDLYDMSFAQASALFKRAYSTITLWEAGLDDDNYYYSGADAVGECHADSVFSEAPVINGGGTVGLASRTLTAHVDSRHDGTKGSGVVIQAVTPGSGTYFISLTITDTTISWLEFDGEDNMPPSGCVNVNAAVDTFIQNCLFYDFTHAGTGNAKILGSTACCPTYTNNFIWNIKSTSTGNLWLWWGYATTRGLKAYNNTVYGIDIDQAGSYIFYNVWGDDETRIRNLVLMDWTAGGLSNVSPHASAVLDYWGLEATHADVDNETVDTVANTFADSTIGDPDLRLKDGSLFVDRGVDLGTSPTNVNISISGRDRSISDDGTWDIGADESTYSLSSLPSSSSASTPEFRKFIRSNVGGIALIQVYSPVKQLGD